MRRSPFIHSSNSILLLKPRMCTGSAPGNSARIFQSPSAIRTGLKLTFALAMRCYGNNSNRNQRVCARRNRLQSRSLIQRQLPPFPMMVLGCQTNIVGPSCSANSRASTAACHFVVSCSALGSLVMQSAASRSVVSARRSEAGLVSRTSDAIARCQNIGSVYISSLFLFLRSPLFNIFSWLLRANCFF